MDKGVFQNRREKFMSSLCVDCALCCFVCVKLSELKVGKGLDLQKSLKSEGFIGRAKRGVNQPPCTDDDQTCSPQGLCDTSPRPFR